MLEGLIDMFRGGGRARLPHIESPPAGVAMRPVRARSAKPVCAKLARRDGVLRSERGDLKYRAGQHYIVEYGGGDRAPVVRDVFERTYRRRFDGAYEKRRDVTLHYFTLPHAAIVETLEGGRRAEAGDWIVQGAAGELYPVAPDYAIRVYEHA